MTTHDTYVTRCLVFQRTGKRCRSCLPRWQNMRYADIVASGRCGQCRRHKFEGGHGKLCASCHEKQQARNRARQPKVRRKVLCKSCGGLGHMAKTCKPNLPPPALLHTAARVPGVYLRQTHAACGAERIQGAQFTSVGRLVTCPACRARLTAKRAQARAVFAVALANVEARGAA